VAGLVLRDLTNAVVRSNSRYRFSSFERLPQIEMRQIGADVATTAFAGVLTDVRSDRPSAKAVSIRTAMLFEQLHTPLRVSAVLTGLSTRERDQILGALVLEGIVEIAVDGAFVSHATAYDLIVQNDDDVLGEGRLAALSLVALKHGQRLGIRNPATLAARLYFYHRMPVTSWSRGLWPDTNAVLHFLGVAPGGALQRDLASCFEMSAQSEQAWWLSWHRRGRGLGAPSGATKCKLYVSATAQHTSKAFAEVVALLSDSTATALKVGPNAHGLQRPDKFVVYFECQEDLLVFAEALLPRLAGLTPHGVPFSAAIDDAGILSWGIDPPDAEAGLGWYADDSWRIWICNRLALALIAALDRSNETIPPWRYALARLWLAGVDTRTWCASGSPVRV
jgi:hypothetical protein